MIDLAEWQKRQRQLTGYMVLFGISLAFYLIFYLQDGIILTEDAPSYINMQSDREPGYCLYLWLFRKIFGNGLSLHAAVIVQCIIAAAAACAITTKLARLFSLNWFGSVGILIIQYGVTLLNRFVAQRKYSYFNSIETEGLAYSLWVFYFLCILGIWYKGDRKSLIGAIGWSVVLISIRKQMMITLVILCLVILFSYIGDRIRKRRRFTDLVPYSAEYFALFVLLAIAVNVCFTSLTIYCQMRYMLYNTGLFYQAWWIMLLQIYKCQKNKKDNCI